MSLFSTRTTTPRERLLEIITAGSPLKPLHLDFEILVNFAANQDYDASPHFSAANTALHSVFASPLHDWGTAKDLPGFYTTVLDKVNDDTALTAAALELRTQHILESTGNRALPAAPEGTPTTAHACTPNPFSNTWACVVSAQEGNHVHLRACADTPDVVGFIGLASTLNTPPLPVPSTLKPIPTIAPAREGAWHFNHRETIKLLIIYALALGQPAIAAAITNDIHAGIFIDGFGAQRPDLQVDSYANLVSRLPHSTLVVD